jgi:hypothetical protein
LKWDWKSCRRPRPLIAPQRFRGETGWHDHGEDRARSPGTVSPEQLERIVTFPPRIRPGRTAESDQQPGSEPVNWNHSAGERRIAVVRRNLRAWLIARWDVDKDDLIPWRLQQAGQPGRRSLIWTAMARSRCSTGEFDHAVHPSALCHGELSLEDGGKSFQKDYHANDILVEGSSGGGDWR